MQYLKLIYIFIVLLQLVITIHSMRWFGFRNNKEDKEDKDDCEPEIVAIRKTKVLPIAVPVYNRKRTYSVKTKKLRRKPEEDEEPDKKAGDDSEEDPNEVVEERSDLLNNEKLNSSKIETNQISERSDSNEKIKLKNDDRIEDDLDDQRENTEYETDEMIKRAIEDDDEDIEEFYSNDDL